MYDLNGTFLEEIIEEKIVEMNNSVEILQIINRSSICIVIILH